MSKISWDEALTLIEAASARARGGAQPAMIEAIRAFLDTAELDGECLPFLAKYKYGEQIYQGGVLRLPGNGAPESVYKTTRGVTLGIIVNNAAEVRPSKGSFAAFDIDDAVPEAVLGPGDWLGLFEVFDDTEEVADYSSPNYDIFAGVRTIFGASEPATGEYQQAVQNALRGRGHTITRAQMPNSHQLGSYFSTLLARNYIVSPWTADVIFFPREFVLALEDSAETPRTLERAELSLRLIRTAWRKRSRTRAGNTSDELLGLVQEVRSDRNFTPELQIAASKFASAVLRVVGGEAPAYVIERNNGEGGPFGDLCALLNDTDMPGWVLIPKHLDHGETGFIRLRDVHPQFFSRSFQERTEQVLQCVGEVMRHTSAAKNHIAIAGDVFRTLSVRVDHAIDRARTAKAKRAKAKARAAAQGGKDEFVVLKLSEAATDPVQIVGQDAFWDCALCEDDRPPLRMPFFRASIRLCRP